MVGREPGAESEGFLCLNIYTPGTGGKPCPVILWIHGGELIQDSANLYDGTTLARNNDIVLVSINYCLRIFGFLDVGRWGPKYAGSANRGYEDHIAALAWATRTVRARMRKNYERLMAWCDFLRFCYGATANRVRTGTTTCVLNKLQNYSILSLT